MSKDREITVYHMKGAVMKKISVSSGLALQDSSQYIRNELSHTQLHNPPFRKPIIVFGGISPDVNFPSDHIKVPKQSDGIPIGEIVAEDSALAIFWPDEELEAAADLPLDMQPVMDLQLRVKELEDHTARDRLEMDQMVEKMKRERWLHHDEKTLLEGRLSEEVLLRQALTVTLNDGRNRIEQLIQRYEEELGDQNHQFGLAFAAVQEEKRIRDLQYQEIQEALQVRNGKYEALLEQLAEMNLDGQEMVRHLQ
jgi:hypothetical protein